MTSPAQLATVIVVNFNGAHLLPACLDGVAAQDIDAGSFRTIVVDNASTDGSRELLADRYPWVEVIESDANRGFAGGNNLALSRIRTQFAALLNNDAIPEPTWLSRVLAPLIAEPEGDLVAVASKIHFLPRYLEVGIRSGSGVRVHSVHLDSVDVTTEVRFGASVRVSVPRPDGVQIRRARPVAAFRIAMHIDAPAAKRLAVVVSARGATDVELAVAGVVSTVHLGRGDGPVEIVADLPENLPLVDVINNAGGMIFRDGTGADRGFDQTDVGQFDSREEVFSFCGNGVAFRVDRAAELGFFDERFFMYYEDIDLAWRLRSRGGRIDYVPDAVLRHVHSATSSPGSAGWTYYVNRNRLFALAKNARASRAIATIVGYGLVSTARWLGSIFMIVVPRQAQKRHHERARMLAILSTTYNLRYLLSSRQATRRSATVPRAQIDTWLRRAPLPPRRRG